MKEYAIPITWKQWGIVYIKAENLQEAIRKTIDGKETPSQNEYIGETEVDFKGIPTYNEGINEQLEEQV